MSVRNTAAKAQAALKTEAKRRIKRVGTAAKQLEEDLKWIANNKAWDLLGYESFASMFEGENGYVAPTYLKVLVIETLTAEGMRPQGVKDGDARASGYTNGMVAQMVGMPAYKERGKTRSPQVDAIRRQLDAGVPAERVVQGTAGRVRDNISSHGRARGTNRQIGLGPEDLVSASVYVPRYVRDWYRNEAKTAVTPIPDAELYRQVLIAHMDKVEAGRKASRRTSRSKGKAA